MRSFEDLGVLQRADRLSLEIHRTSLQLPGHERYGLADPLRRASKSIGVNIAEGFGQAKLFGAAVQALSPRGCKGLIEVGGVAKGRRLWPSVV